MQQFEQRSVYLTTHFIDEEMSLIWLLKFPTWAKFTKPAPKPSFPKLDPLS